MGGFQWDRRQQYGLKNQYGWLCLCTKVAIGVYLTKWWKIFCCGVKIEHCYKDIGIREYSEKLSHYCFQNAFLLRLGLQLIIYLSLMMLMIKNWWDIFIVLVFPLPYPVMHMIFLLLNPVGPVTFNSLFFVWRLSLFTAYCFEILKQIGGWGV